MRELVNNGVLNYPLSTRELVNIVKHLEKFPEDNLVDAMNNVFSFDLYDRQLIEQLSKIFHKHGFPFQKTIDFSINIGKETKIPNFFVSQFWNYFGHEENKNNLILTEYNLKNKNPWIFQIRSTSEIKGRTEWRIKEFGELKFSWNSISKGSVKGMCLLGNNLFILTMNPLELHFYHENLMEYKVINIESHIPQIYSLIINPQLLKLTSSKRLLIFIPVYDVIILVDPNERIMQPISFPQRNKKFKIFSEKIYLDMNISKKQNIDQYSFVFQELSRYDLIVIMENFENTSQIFILDFSPQNKSGSYCNVFSIENNLPRELNFKIHSIFFISLNFWILQLEDSTKYSLILDFNLLDRKLKVISLQKIIIINESESWQIKENKSLIPRFINNLFNNNQQQTLFTSNGILFNYFIDNLNEIDFGKKISPLNTQVYSCERKKEGFEKDETLQSFFLSKTSQLVNLRNITQKEQSDLYLEIVNFERGNFFKKFLSNLMVIIYNFL